MVFENIERLQRQLTDKYVVVDGARPELQRFTGMTGVVKTVNFSGRALVEFDANNNIGWFDIDPRFLKVIDAPLPKPAAKEKKAAPAKIDKPADAKPIGESKPVAKPAAASIADILAAARGEGKPGAVAKTEAAKPEAKPAAAKPSLSTADILAAARSKPTPAATPASPPIAPGKMSTADILAMARGNKATAPAAPPVVQPVEVEVVPEPVVIEAAAPISEPVVASSAPVAVDRTKMDTAAMLAYCRKVDGQG